MNASGTQLATRPARRGLETHLDRIGWGLFLIMIGGLALVPDQLAPAGTWLVGLGTIILGLSLVRWLNGIRTSTFSLVLGLVALGCGLSSVAGVEFPVLPIVLITVGVQLLLRVAGEKKPN